MSTADLLSKNILQSKGMIDSALADFSDADMMFRPAKTANHAIWQMGHLCNSVRGMVTTCDPSVAFPFEDDTRFGKSKAPKLQVSASWYSLSRSVVGTSRCITSVSGWRFADKTSLPISAKPIALISNASRFRCSSTIVVLIRVALDAVFTRSGAASA